MKLGKKFKKEKHLNENESVESQSAVDQGTDVTEATQTDDAPVEAKNETGPTQREAVYQEVLRVMQDEQIPYDPSQPVKPLLNEASLKRVCSGLVASFIAEKIPMKPTESNQRKLTDVKLLELYVIGLVNNWLKRDKRLNGKGAASI